MKIEKKGSRRPVKARLIGRGAIDFFVPEMIGRFTAMSPYVLTQDARGIADKAPDYWVGMEKNDASANSGAWKTATCQQI